MTMTISRIFIAASMTLTMALAASPAASAKQTGQVFISSEKDDVITVLDGKTQQQIASIAVCKRPRDMRLTRDRLRLIAVCGDDGIAIVVDVASRTVVDKIKLQEGVEIFDLSPDGKKLYFSNEDEASIVVVDLVAKKIINQIKVGEEPEGVLLTPDGKTLYATSEVAGLVHVIDLVSGKIVKNIEVAKRPRRLALTPDGKELWVTCEVGASVAVIRTADNTLLDNIQFQPKGFRVDDISPVGITVSSDGKSAFVGLGRANHVAQVDIASRKVRNLILVGKRAWGLALSRDNATLYVANGLSDDVSVVDVASGRAVKTVRAGRVPHSVVIDD